MYIIYYIYIYIYIYIYNIYVHVLSTLNMTISCCIYCNYKYTSYGCMQLTGIIAFNIYLKCTTYIVYFR